MQREIRVSSIPPRWLRRDLTVDDFIDKEERQICIECSFPVDLDEPIKNCHGNCRIEL